MNDGLKSEAGYDVSRWKLLDKLRELEMILKEMLDSIKRIEEEARKG